MTGPVTTGKPRPEVGRSRTRKEDARLITGRTTWTDNITVPGLLHLAILRSPMAHARIDRVDVSRALERPGVIAALTGRDLAGELGPMPCVWPVTEDIVMPDHPAVAVDEVRYAGEPVALVVARGRYAAADALEAVEVDCTPLPPVLGLETRWPTTPRSSTRTRAPTAATPGRWPRGTTRRRRPRRVAAHLLEANEADLDFSAGTFSVKQALYEEAVYDTEGNLVSGTMADYPVPAAPDLSDFVTDRTETPATSNALGVKGVGEAGTIASTPAVVNAVVDALRPLGVRDVAMPCTPLRIWQAVEDARAKGATT